MGAPTTTLHRGGIVLAAATALAVGLTGTAHADEVHPYLGWTAGLQPGDCGVVAPKKESRQLRVDPVNPDEHNSGWLVDSEVSEPSGNKDTRQAMNGVTKVQVTVVCDGTPGGGFVSFAPTEYVHKERHDGIYCSPPLPAKQACMPYHTEGTGWQPGLAVNAR